MSIVTLSCNLGRHRAVSFDVTGVFSDRVFLTDLCADWNGYASVTDAAEEVCRHCHANYGTKRVICRDTKWKWRELVHEDGAFKGFAPYHERFPFRIIAEMILRSSGA